MGTINIGRVIIGGIVAGIVGNILGFLADGVIFAPQWAAGMNADLALSVLLADDEVDQLRESVANNHPLDRLKILSHMHWAEASLRSART